jgi:hypothetical protein
MYNTYNVARPWEGDPTPYWDNNDWSTGQGAFFTWVAWLAQRNGLSKGFSFGGYEPCPYEIRVVPWPLGPSSGGKDNVAGGNIKGNVYMLPKGTIHPDIVFDVFFEYNNWYEYDIELRDEASMWVEDYYTDDFSGLEYTIYLAGRPQLDLWDYLNARNAEGNGFGVGGLLDGSTTPAQLAQEWRLIMQDYIDIAYGKK